VGAGRDQRSSSALRMNSESGGLFGNHLHICQDLAALGHENRLTLILILPQDLRIEICVWLDSFPRKDLVVSGCNSSQRELAALVRDCSFDQIDAVAILIRNENCLERWTP